MMGIKGSRLSITPWDIWVVIALFILLAFYMIIQLIPLGYIDARFLVIRTDLTDLPSKTISLTPGDTFLGLIRWLSYGFMFFLTMQLCARTSRAAKFVHWLFWCVAAHAVIGLVLLYQFNDTIFGIPKWDHYGSATGGFPNRNSFATFLAFGSILGTILLLNSYKHIFNSVKQQHSPSSLYFKMTTIIPTLLGWLTIVSALIATNSRMGILAAICGMMCCVLLDASHLDAKIRRKTFGIYMVGIFVLGAPLLYLYGAHYIKRLGQLESGDINYRLTLYNQVLDMIKARPFLGFGGDSFEYAFPLFHQPHMDIDLVSQKAHSTYLGLWADYGIIFGSIPLLMIGYLFCTLCRVYMKRAHSDPILLVAIGVIIVGAVHSLVDFSLEIEAVVFIFVAIVAAGYAQIFIKEPKYFHAYNSTIV